MLHTAPLYQSAATTFSSEIMLPAAVIGLGGDIDPNNRHCPRGTRWYSPWARCYVLVIVKGNDDLRCTVDPDSVHQKADEKSIVCSVPATPEPTR